jgi:hypothetical protein
VSVRGAERGTARVRATLHPPWHSSPRGTDMTRGPTGICGCRCSHVDDALRISDAASRYVNISSQHRAYITSTLLAA